MNSGRKGRAPLAAACLALLAVVAGCGRDTVMEEAGDRLTLRTFAKAVEASGIEEQLETDKPMTLFAPTNAAFDKLKPGMLDQLMETNNRALLRDIIEFHIVPGTLTSKDLADGASIRTREGKRIHIRVVKGEIMVNEARVVRRDIKCSNGVIHMIDRVLIP